MRLLRERYACLWSTATKPNLQTMHYQPDTTMPTTTTTTTITQCSNDNPTNILLPSDSLPNPSLNDPSSEVNNKFTVTVGALPMTNCAPITSPLR